MALGGYDGSIRIDTKIDAKGIDKGVKKINASVDKIGKSSKGLANINKIDASVGKMGKSLKGLASIAGLAFAVTAVVNFGKASVKASTDLSNAMLGLKSIMEGQSRSFSQAQDFINEYVSDGLLPATEAVTAYKNLAMRGYTDPQIQQVLVALKDSAAFGRQASLSLGQAVSSATEGLKNENSILVDNAGVTKNVSMMWKEYAESIGVGVQALTKQQKIQAEVNGILQESRYQIGDAAKMSHTYSGEILRLQFGFNNLKIAIGNMITPIVQKILPSLNAVLGGITKIANQISQIVVSLFGQVQQSANEQSSLTDSVMDTVNAEDKLATSAEKAKNTLLGFDEINTLDFSESDVPAPSDPGGGSVNRPNGDTQLGENAELNPKLAAALDKLKKLLEPLQTISFDNLSTSLSRLWDSLKNFANKVIFENLEWAYFNVFVPFANFYIEEVLPRFFDTLALAIEGAGAVISGVADVFKTFFKHVLEPIAKFAGGKFIDFWDRLKEKFGGFVDTIKGSSVFDDLQEFIKIVGPSIVEFTKKLINFFSFNVEVKWMNMLDKAKFAFKTLEDAVGLVVALLNGDFSDALEHLKNIFVDNPFEFIKDSFKSFGTSLMGSLGLLDDVITSVDVFGNEISDTTKAKVQPFIDRMRDFDDSIASIDFQNLKIDQSIVDDVTAKTQAISSIILSELDADKNEALANINPLKKVLNNADYDALVSANENYYNNLTIGVKGKEAEINQILSTAKNENRTLTQQEHDDITRIRDTMNKTGIAHLSESELEYRTIMTRLKDNSTRISLEQGSKII